MKAIETTVAPEEPRGARIIIENLPWLPRWSKPGFERCGIQVSSFTDIDESAIVDWPMVYILTNDKEAYVGQTTSVIRRMGEHGSANDKKGFTQLTVIYSPEFNASVTLDYEHHLIQLMSADGLYKLTNKNEGMRDSNYFCKPQYDEIFRQMWEQLKKHHLVQHTITEIEESEVFKYSPYKSLNPEQEDALIEILNRLERNLLDSPTETLEPIVVEGMPGTGKTVLAVFLIKALKDRYGGTLNIRLLEPIESLRRSLGESFKNIHGLSPDDVIGPSDLIKPKYGYRAEQRGNFDVLLVDEVHRLKGRRNIQAYESFDKVSKEFGFAPETCTQLDWVVSQSKIPILFYDPLQSVGPSGITQDEAAGTIGSGMDKAIHLESQMRVKGGGDYLEYVRALLIGSAREAQDFPDYDFVIHDKFDNFMISFESTLEKHSLTRMIAGYAWEWKSKSDRTAYDIEIESARLKWNRQQQNWVGLAAQDPTAAHEVGCVHSIQGYDLTYAYVIIGNDLKYDGDNGRLYIDRSSYYDRNGKNTTTDEELLRYLQNIYYVLMTRGIYGTHLYVCDSGLKRYLQRFIPSGD